MARIVTAEELRARLVCELDELSDSEEALYVSKRGRPSAGVLDSERYTALVERLEYLEDSLAALIAREKPASSIAWSGVRAA